MSTAAFELEESIKLKTIEYPLNPDLWKMFDLDLDLDFSKWVTYKYLNDDGSSLNPEVDNIPKNKGGVYLFFVKCPIIPGISEFPFYIGRAYKTEHQNLRKRIKEYYYNYKKGSDRPKIKKMFKYWKNELYLSFLELEQNEQTKDLERKLINSLLLPMNDEIPDKRIKAAKKAFS